VSYSRPFIHPAYTQIILFVQLTTKRKVRLTLNTQRILKEQRIYNKFSVWLYNYV